MYYESGKRNLKVEEESKCLNFTVFADDDNSVRERLKKIESAEKQTASLKKEERLKAERQVEKKRKLAAKVTPEKDRATLRAEQIAKTPPENLCVCGKVGICNNPEDTSRTYDDSAYKKKLKEFRQKHPPHLMAVKRAELEAYKKKKKNKGKKRKQEEM